MILSVAAVDATSSQPRSTRPRLPFPNHRDESRNGAHTRIAIQYSVDAKRSPAKALPSSPIVRPRTNAPIATAAGALRSASSPSGFSTFKRHAGEFMAGSRNSSFGLRQLVVDLSGGGPALPSILARTDSTSFQEDGSKPSAAITPASATISPSTTTLDSP